MTLAAAVLALSASAATAAGQKMTDWDAKHPIKVAARIGELKVENVATRPDPNWELGVKVITFIDNAGRRGKLEAVVAFDDVSATIGVGRIDPDSAKEQVLLTSFTGGAHCCVDIQLLDWVDGAWRTVKIGLFDGEPFEVAPTDVDGDGIIDIVHNDDRFAYQFGCYACSWMPPRIFNVRGAKVIDVSAAPRYRKLFEADYAKAKAACAKGQFSESYTSGYCAGMVADGVRLGRADEAWTLARQHVNPKTAEWPQACRTTPIKGGCPKNQTLTFNTFEEALRWFLARNGY